MSTAKGKLKKVFPGGNTSRGFHSFYDYIIEPDATRIFVIKGGPGVGKSTFMRKIGETMLGKGYDVEFHCCSSDNDSLDGIVIPALRIAMLDGTAPHVVDPKNPGVVDEILHLGDHWNEEGLRKHKTQILACNKEVGRLFNRAYTYLSTANIFLNEVKFYYRGTGAFDVAAFDEKVLELTHDIFEGKPRHTDSPKERRLFATAITPKGPESHLETIVGHLNKRYIIAGDDGTGKNTLVRRLMEAAMMRGYDVEAYHCTLDPSLIDHLVIPALSTAIINAVEPHYYNAKTNDTIIDTMAFVSPILNKRYLNEKNKAREMYRQSMEQAIWFLSQAKKEHDIMEEFYVPYMKFDEVNLRREKILQRILALADVIQ